MTPPTEGAPAQGTTAPGAPNGSTAQATTDAAKPGTTTTEAKPAAAAGATTQAPANGQVPPAEKTDKGPATVPGAEAKAQESAELELKFPEGVAVDQQFLTSFRGVAKELGLDAPKAQKLADLYAGQAKAQEQRFAQQVEATQKQWQEQLAADKDFGGTQLAANRSIAAKAIDKFGGPEVRQILEQSGLGNHPALVRAFVRIGKEISEDSVSGAAAGGKGEQSEQEKLDVLYPTMSKK